MGSVILCQIKQAEMPYYIESIGINVYSIEELCYYLSRNLYLIDDSIMNEGLYQWIGEELELPALAGKLRTVHGKAAGVEEFLYPILKESNYLSYDEVKSLNHQIQLMKRESEVLREKRKGDALVENGVYGKAIQVYQEILKKDLKRQRRGFEGAIWYNLGCTFSYLLQKEKALECFEKAYWLLRTGESLKSYLLMYRETYSIREYEKKIKEMGIDSRTSQEISKVRRDFLRQSGKKAEEKDMGKTLKELTREYHRNTGT